MKLMLTKNKFQKKEHNSIKYFIGYMMMMMILLVVNNLKYQ